MTPYLNLQPSPRFSPCANAELCMCFKAPTELGYCKMLVWKHSNVKVTLNYLHQDNTELYAGNVPGLYLKQLAKVYNKLLDKLQGAGQVITVVRVAICQFCTGGMKYQFNFIGQLSQKLKAHCWPKVAGWVKHRAAHSGALG